MSPYITLQSEHLGVDTVRIDVSGRDLPEDFLGMAFDLTVDGTWALDRSEPCGGFKNNDTIVQLVSAQPQQEKVVFGMVLTAQTDIKPQDGCITSFYFRMDPALERKVFFDHATLSVNRNGRRDLVDVRWEQGFVVFPSDREGQEALSQSQNGESGRAAQEAAVPQYGPFQPGGALKADFLESFDASLISVYLVIFFTLALSAAVFGVIWVYFRLRKKG